MKIFCIVVASFSVASAFVAPSFNNNVRLVTASTSMFAANLDEAHASVVTSRADFFKATTAASAAAASLLFATGVAQPEAAQARGRATLEQAYRKFTPRIVAGGDFYSTDMKKLVATSDWEGIKNALQEPPGRSKEDLVKSDSGVAARARQAGQFSDARVLVAADLFAAAFSESSISPKTRKMQAAVVKMRAVVEEMESVSKQALGEESGGLFGGLLGKKVDKAALQTQLRALYVEGGNAYNEYVLAANENLALLFDKLPYIK
jgi:hypothetical protein